MEENKDLRDEELVEESNTVEGNTEATENEEVEEIIEEYSETDDLSMIRKLKDKNKKLSNEGFVAKAPAKLLDEEKAKKEKYETMLANVNERLANLNK